MPFLKCDQGEYLRVFRGECVHPDLSSPKAFPRALYFGDVETANNYADAEANSGDYYTSRVYPAYLVLNKPFIRQPTDAYLELGLVANLLGRDEAVRIAKRFHKYVEETDNWTQLINADGRFADVTAYLNSPIGDVGQLYFQAYRFFDSLMEVGRLVKRGYDGAIHAGCGQGSEGRTEYCVFNREQVFFTASKSFLRK